MNLVCFIFNILKNVLITNFARRPSQASRTKTITNMFKDVVNQAFAREHGSSLKFQCERKVADPMEIAHRLQYMLGRSRPIKVQTLVRLAGEKWESPAPHDVYVLTSGDERLAGYKVHMPAGLGQATAKWVAIQMRVSGHSDEPKTVTIQGCKSALLNYAQAWALTLGRLQGLARTEKEASDLNDYGYD